MLRVIGSKDVTRLLDYKSCIAVVRDAMAELSGGQTRQMLRQVVPVANENVLSVMAGVMRPEIGFGSKVISVYPGNTHLDRQSHQGVVVLFDEATGAPICILHAGELTRIRTAAASAVATDALARSDASTLAVLGYGDQGIAHIEAITQVRNIASVRLWGRSAEHAGAVAMDLSRQLGLLVEPAATVAEAVRNADIVCTTTAAADPILMSEWVAEGTHLNLVGSSVAAFAEVDNQLVARGRFFADHREGVLRQGGEYLRAVAAGLVDETHVLGEIGQILNSVLPGRTAEHDVTIYKSLGHIVQDIACAQYLYRVAENHHAGASLVF